MVGGKVAYIYLSDMGGLGMDQFIRQFYAQLDKQALIVDDRWNGGGFGPCWTQTPIGNVWNCGR